MKSHCLRTVENHCKASKIHSFGDVCPGHGKGKGGKVAFVIGWFNCVDSFSQLIQLGTGNGAYPLADERKLAYFPFLIKKDKNFPNHTKNLTYDYVNAYTESPVRISSERKGKYRCMFIGKKDDKFHFALYYGEQRIQNGYKLKSGIYL